MASSLPPEMWEAVFDRVDDPKDFQSVINSNEDWNDLMSYKKTTRLFPLVFETLLRVEPEFKTLENMLLLRQVHPLWKQVADTELEMNTRDSNFGYSNDYFDDKYSLWEEDMERMAAFSASLPSSSNPFLGRYLNSYTTGPTGAMNRAFEKHGSNVKMWLLEYEEPISPTEFGRSLRFLPNLEALRFFTSFEVAENWLSETPFPPLPRLTKLDAYWMFVTIPEEGQNERELLSTLLTAYGAKLTSLGCVYQLFRLNGISQLLPNLVELRIRDTVQLTQEDIQVMSQVGWRLKSLEINLFQQNQDAVSGVLSALGSFSATLENLDLSLLWEQVSNFDPSSLPVFPRLKILKLNVIKPKSSPIIEEARTRLLSLARVCPNLETVKIWIQIRARRTATDDEDMRNMRTVFMNMFAALKECVCDLSW